MDIDIEPAPGGARPADARADAGARADARAPAASIPEPSADRLADLERALGYGFRDRALLERALRHRSARAPGRPPNERLEFLGDAVLGLAVSRALFDRFPEAREGELTRIRSEVVSAPALARAAGRLGLGDALELGRGVHGERGARGLPPSLLADALEAVVGAAYLDGGLGAATALALGLLGGEIEAAAEHVGARNWKAILQELVQHHLQRTPSYAVIGEDGPDHRKRFAAAALLDGRELGRGEGRSKREAEQQAARAALGGLLGEDRARVLRDGEIPALDGAAAARLRGEPAAG